MRLFFGEITGFRVVHRYDESLRLARDGTLIERVPGPFQGPCGSVHVGGTVWTRAPELPL